MLRINELKLPLDAGESKLFAAAAKELKIHPKHIVKLQIRKKAVDARKKDNIRFTYCVDVELNIAENGVLKKASKKVSIAENRKYMLPKAEKPPEKPPVIIGMGPAGMLCGLMLAEAGFKPILLERGEAVDNRRKTVEEFWRTGKLNPNSNVQFGQGGAGTFSDGKLTTNTKDKRNSKVLAVFREHGAPEDIMYSAKPHIGTDILGNVVKSIGEKTESLGGTLYFNSQVVDILTDNRKIIGVKVKDKTGIHEIFSNDVILAIGHSAKDTFEMLYRNNVPMQAKPFSVGARIEHLQADINRSQYGDFAESPYLGAADYKLSCHLPNGRSVYTFCMCPGGKVVNASSETGAVVTNGMSYHSRNGKNANAAVLVAVNPKDFGSSHPLAGMEFQRKIEQAAYNVSGGYSAICQKAGDFLNNKPTTETGKVKPSCLPNVHLGKIDDCLPPYVTEAMREGLKIFGQKLKGFADDDAVLTAPETRSSSPVRINRNENYQSLEGLYPCGEGAGYAGGIMSAAADGIKTAEAVIKKYALKQEKQNSF